ncbi:MAG: glycyl-radical enzyme activating protein [Theionarchaea archaeon]|nr:glycyl-radical enzyme activating protein [Theionarchaea archaeon]
MTRSARGLIFAIDETATHDGPGLRMTIYLKGCPLNCVWCHSPESISPSPQVVWYENRCLKCGRCIEACPEGLRSNEGTDDLDREGCRLCGTCVEACPNSALEIKGYPVTAGEIVDHAVQLIPFFEKSGGGITLTGGEPTLQMDFTRSILELCREKGIHTAVETCGQAAWEKFKRLVPLTDLFLYDVKHLDEERHREFTGVSNSLILGNLERLLQGGSEVILRLPLIPGYNDSRVQVEKLGRKAIELGAKKVTLLPFNPASAGKYSWFHRSYPPGNVVRQDDGFIRELGDMLEEMGLEVIPS